MRERYLDVIRAIALLRVILWHALGAAALTYFVAAVPAMFFVTGSLLAKSLASRPARDVVLDRLRRLLVPLWAFTAYAFVVMWIANIRHATSDTQVPWRQVIVWLLPFEDPSGSVWEAGYLSAPLWYLRVLLWLLLLTPLLHRLVRRVGIGALALPLLALAITGHLKARGLLPAERGWQIGDFGLYGTFVVLGMVHRDGRFDGWPRSRWLMMSGATAVAAAAYVALRPPPDWVVNDSHSLHLLVGLTWLGVGLALRPELEWVGMSGSIGPVIDAIAHRSMSIYLWHTTAIVAVYWLLSGRQWPSGVHTLLLVLLVLPLAWLIAQLVGWIEDWAGRRQIVWPIGRRPTTPTRRPVELRRLTAAGVVVAALVSGAFLSGTSSSSGAPSMTGLRIPSRQPPPPVFDDAASTTPAQPVDPDVVADQLHDYVAAWLSRQSAPGIQVAVTRQGMFTWSDAFGTDVTESYALTVDDSFQLASLTKSFTAILVWQAVDAGLIELDQPLPPLEDVPDFPYAGRITVRQLLGHTSGLQTSYDVDGVPVTSAVRAVRRTGKLPLTQEPGASVEYSSVNYLVLGFLLEQVTNRSYDDLLMELATRSGIGEIRHIAPQTGTPNFSTAGIELTIAELVRWGETLGDPTTVGVSDESVQQMRTFDPGSGIGLGQWAYCPCVEVDGQPSWATVGHSGPTAVVRFSIDDSVSMAINLSGYTFLEDVYPAINELFAGLQAIATGRAMTG